ncbi:hypothetical protein J2S40_003084 [Nocardioides luteus]|uniref:Uncharacterized protein n=1 Tax=Nocardioides luteus TaxID=1844 RepID=A0ABQ5SVU6_9ACTN|nr:hypothetical protein [Nocardioides luteus]MDR7312026.1 hypothetical protein [Nocardioides luteus]GGR72042.1 hypothetical protein GCM10010197_44300 [Nocardioides luteus]GLJ68272.1 hypothetical protein GCM10017579_23080 [Nocardioides luteus]
MKTLAGDPITLQRVSEPAGDGGLWVATCTGCGWTSSEPGWATYKDPTIAAARRHAECTGDQGALW